MTLNLTFLNEMNEKELPAMYSTAFWCLFDVLLFFFLALSRNHCYSFHRTKGVTVVLLSMEIVCKAYAGANSCIRVVSQQRPSDPHILPKENAWPNPN